MSNTASGMTFRDFLENMEGLKVLGWTGCYVGDRIRLKAPGAGAGQTMCPLAALALVECRIACLDAEVYAKTAPLLGMSDYRCGILLDSIDTKTAGDPGIRASLIDLFGLDNGGVS